jgi:hypothetical protein
VERQRVSEMRGYDSSGWRTSFGVCGGHLRSDGSKTQRCALIDAEKVNYPVAWMCQILWEPRSSFHDWQRTTHGVRERRWPWRTDAPKLWVQYTLDGKCSAKPRFEGVRGMV